MGQLSWELVVHCACFAGFQREKHGLHETRYCCFTPKQWQCLRPGADRNGPCSCVPLGSSASSYSSHGCLCRSWTPESSEDCRYGGERLQKRFPVLYTRLELVDWTRLWQTLLSQMRSWFGTKDKSDFWKWLNIHTPKRLSLFYLWSLGLPPPVSALFPAGCARSEALFVKAGKDTTSWSEHACCTTGFALRRPPRSFKWVVTVKY